MEKMNPGRHGSARRHTPPSAGGATHRLARRAARQRPHLRGLARSTRNAHASLRRIGTATYRMLVYDHTLCYRRLVQDAVVTLRRHRLLFGEEEDCGANRVEYDPAADRLTLGCYGLFLPDDATHPPPKSSKHPSNSYGKTSGTPSGVAAPRRRGSPAPSGSSPTPRTSHRVSSTPPMKWYTPPRRRKACCRTSSRR